MTTTTTDIEGLRKQLAVASQRGQLFATDLIDRLVASEISGLGTIVGVAITSGEVQVIAERPSGAVFLAILDRGVAGIVVHEPYRLVHLLPRKLCSPWATDEPDAKVFCHLTDGHAGAHDFWRREEKVCR